MFTEGEEMYLQGEGLRSPGSSPHPGKENLAVFGWLFLGKEAFH